MTMIFSASPVGATSQTKQPGKSFQATGHGQVSPHKVSTFSIPQVKGTGRGTIPARPAPGGRTPVPPPQNVVRIPVPGKSSYFVKANFEGQDNTGWVPSDSNGVPGLNNYFETVNEQFEVYSRTGSPQYGTSFNAWFGQSGSLFDPKVVWDNRGKRFIFLVDTGSSLLISVAQQQNGIGNYCTYGFPTLTNYFADYPQLGVDPDGIYFGANMYGSPYTNQLFFANRTEMETCSNTGYTYWTNLTNPDGSIAFTIVPSVEHAAANGVEYLVNSYSGGSCQITLWKLTRAGSLNNSTVYTQCYSPPPPATQLGSSGTIETLDNRLYQASYLRNVLVFDTVGSYDWGDGNGPVGIVEYFEINPSNGSVVQQYTFGAPGYWLFFPAVDQNRLGKIYFVFNTSGPNNDPSIWGISGCLCDTYIVANGVSHYGESGQARWGDFQSAWLDPTGSNAIYVTGQYVNSTDSWGTRIASVIPS